MTATVPFDWRGLLAGTRRGPSWPFDSAMDRGVISPCESFDKGLSSNEQGCWRNLGPEERGAMVSTRTSRSCETLLRNSAVRGREFGWKAPSGSNLGGRVLCPVLSGEEGDRRCDACRLGRFGTRNSTSRSGFSMLQKHMLVAKSGAVGRRNDALMLELMKAQGRF